MIAAHPDLDVLVNNMGIFEPRPFERITDEDWLRFFEANVLSGIRLARHYVGGMRARDWGRIVFVSSQRVSSQPWPSTTRPRCARQNASIRPAMAS